MRLLWPCIAGLLVLDIRKKPCTLSGCSCGWDSDLGTFDRHYAMVTRDRLPQRNTADMSDGADTAPEPPRTPEQPTAAISRGTPSKNRARESLDTRIVPRALWATEKGMDQEQALLIVAMHDAGFLLDALARVQAQRSMADFWYRMKGSWLIAIHSQRRWLRPQTRVQRILQRKAAERRAAERQAAWERQADKQHSKQQQQAVTKQPQQQQQHPT